MKTIAAVRNAPSLLRTSRIGSRRLRGLARERDRLREEGKLLDALAIARRMVAVAPGRENCFRLGVILRELGRHREALRIFRRAARFRGGRRGLLREIHLHQAHAWLSLGRTVEMRRALRRALRASAGISSDANLRLVLGNDRLQRREFDEAVAEYAIAEETAPTPFARGRAIENQGVALYRMGRHAEALRRFEDAGRLYCTHGHRGAFAGNQVRRAAVWFDIGRRRRALVLCRRALRTARALGQTAFEAEMFQNTGYVASEVGLLDQGLPLLNRALFLAKPLQLWRVLIPGHACRAALRASSGDFDGAHEDLCRARHLLMGKRFTLGTFFVHRAEARTAEVRGDWREMMKAAARGKRVAAAAGDRARVAEFHGIRAEALRRMGKPEAAARIGETARDLVAEIRRRFLDLRRLENAARRLAPGRLSVLILGRAGRERIRIARRIHESGPRKSGPCVVVPCEMLVFSQSELAGNLPGAWTGADRATTGFIGEARGGTLILDCLDELDPEAQRALTRLLDGHVRPVGGGAERETDVRFIATARDGSKLIPAVRRRIAGAVIRIPDSAAARLAGRAR